MFTKVVFVVSYLFYDIPRTPVSAVIISHTNSTAVLFGTLANYQSRVDERIFWKQISNM